MKLRIESDGTPAGTRVLDENGKAIENVVGLTWELGVGGIARCKMQLVATPVDVVGTEDPVQ